jgi:adenosylhomocysteine nucleosidase
VAGPTAIVSALHEEMAAVLELIGMPSPFGLRREPASGRPGAGLKPNEQLQTIGGRSFWRGHLHGHEVVAVLSGIGKVAAATTATALIERFGVQRIVFTGVAGGLGEGVKVGDVVVAQRFLQHDMDASPIFPRHEVPGYGRSTFLADAELTTQLLRASEGVLRSLPAQLSEAVRSAFGLHAPRCHQGLLISGDRFVSTTVGSKALCRELPDALAVEMEGAAFAQVCHDYGVPLAVVRTISDRADDAAHVDFPRFLSEVASRYSSSIIDAWLTQR